MVAKQRLGPESRVSNPRMTPQQFAAKWTASKLNERSGSHQHFIDLCHVLGEPAPADADLDGEFYCFERGAVKTTGGKGWADVWRRGCFAREYKGKHKDLNVAYAQLQRYAPALDNPPLLVVSDMAIIEVHTNFTNAVHEKHVIPITELGSEKYLKILKAVFSDPEALRPGKTKAIVTADAAERFAALAQVLRGRGGAPELVANFLNRILFCFYAQHARLLPSGVVTQLFEAGIRHPDQANRMLHALFRAMKKGGEFGPHIIEWFNGGLFENPDSVPLEAGDIKELLTVARMDWSEIEPSIFGTLFERGLDPSKRAQIGAHYTDPESIMRIVKPVVLEPLVVEWRKELEEIREVLNKWEKGRDRAARTKIKNRAQQIFNAFLRKLAEFRVLDPACGSGNFLYLSLQVLKDLEHRATLDAEQLGLQAPLEGMHVGVHCLHGIELNSYAADLARVTVWIGEIQWMLRHGMQPSMNPILKPLDTIECRDAVCMLDEIGVQWPSADVIVGNPPFLGNKRMLSELGESYTARLRKQFKDRLPGGVDLVTYWFERAREQVEDKKSERVGLVATQAIRKGANRAVLDRITTTAPIFEAWTNQPWINEGAAVRVSVIAFGRGAGERRLDGQIVDEINPDLTSRANANLLKARSLPENRGVCFMGTSKVGCFDIPGNLARSWLKLPNASGVQNSDVLRPWANGQSLAGRPADTWIIDFGTNMSLAKAAMYEAPFAYVQENVQPERKRQRRDAYRNRWWIHAEARPGLRGALRPLSRYLATPRVAKHRFFVWLPVGVLPDSRLFAICREDDFAFGVLSSRFHSVWALANASRHGIGNDPTYNASSCFETFPFPEGGKKVRNSIVQAGQRLDSLRGRWLNPSQWVDVIDSPVAHCSPRFVPKQGHEAELKLRTMTNLYNERPVWLENAHEELDRAVAGAYGWKDYTPQMPDDAILARLLKLNVYRAADLLAPLEKHLAVVRTEGGRKHPSSNASGLTSNRRKFA